MRRLLLALASTLMLLAGCSSPFTEIVVVVTADSSLLVPSDIDQVQIELTPNAEMREQSFLTERGALTDFPVTFGVRPTRSGTRSVVTVTVRGLKNGLVRTTRMVRAQFVEGERRFVIVNLQASCVDVLCDELCDSSGDSGTCAPACENGSCVALPMIPTNIVPSEWNDAGVLDFDVGIRPDAFIPDVGVDAPDTYVPPDAWPYSCEGVNTQQGQGPGGSVVELQGIESRPICVTPGAYPDGGLIITPTEDDPPVTYRWALHQPVLDQSADVYADLGFDLDGYGSDGLDPRAGECLRSGNAVPADGVRGTDNFFGLSLMRSLVNAAPILGIPDPERALADRVNAGMLAPILTLSGWNGEAFDTQVTAGLAFAIDVAPASYMGGPPTRLGGIGQRPAWDGTDRAYIQCAALEGCSQGTANIDRPQVLDETAYVSNNYLVLSMSAGYPLQLPIGDSNGQADFNIVGGRVIAHLAPDGTIDQLVRIVGRIPKNLFFQYLESVGLCPGLAYYAVIFNSIDTQVDQALDLLPRPNVPGDISPQDSPCRAFSLMFLFNEATPVTAAASDIVNIRGMRVGCEAPRSDAGPTPDANLDVGLLSPDGGT